MEALNTNIVIKIEAVVSNNAICMYNAHWLISNIPNMALVKTGAVLRKRRLNMYFINEFDIFMLSENKNLLVNYLSGAVDIIDYKTNVAILNKNLALLDDSIIQQLYSRNYIFDTKEKYSAYTDKLNYKLLDSERKQKPNFLLIPTYNCNLDCTYCYEKNYVIEKFNGNMHFSKNITDSLFTAIEELSKENELQSNNNDTSEFTNITLMGGEPLFSDNDTILSCIFNKLNRLEKF